MWCIFEKVLWVLLFFGGFVGFLVVMVVFYYKILKFEFKYGVLFIYLIESIIFYFVSKDFFWIVALMIFLLFLILVVFKIFFFKDNFNKCFKNNKRDKK